MGDEFLRKRGKRFKNLSDEDYDQKLAAQNLFSDRQHIFAEQYPFVLDGDAEPLNVGDEVTVYDSDPSYDDLLVRRGSQVVGIIVAADANNLREAMRHDPRCGGVVKAIVERQSRISKRIHIRISETNLPCVKPNGTYS